MDLQFPLTPILCIHGKTDIIFKFILIDPHFPFNMQRWNSSLFSFSVRQKPTFCQTSCHFIQTHICISRCSSDFNGTHQCQVTKPKECLPLFALQTQDQDPFVSHVEPKICVNLR